MNKKVNREITVGVTIILIASFLLWVISLFTDYLEILLSAIKSFFIWSWTALNLNYSLPGWAWLLIFSLLFVGLRCLYQGLKPSAKLSTPAEVQNYIQDNIENVIWRWNWSGQKIINLTPFCPVCDGLLIFQQQYDVFSRRNNVYLVCEHCNNQIFGKIPGSSYDDVSGRIFREIDRRIRTGEHLLQKD